MEYSWGGPQGRQVCRRGGFPEPTILGGSQFRETELSTQGCEERLPRRCPEKGESLPGYPMANRVVKKKENAWPPTHAAWSVDREEVGKRGD